MGRRTTGTRRLLAAATLAALPLFTGTLHSAPVAAADAAAHARDAAEGRNGPQWSFVLGRDDGDRTGCWILSGWAEVWCRVYAL